MFRISVGSAAESRLPDTKPVEKDKDWEVDDDWSDHGRVSKTLTVISIQPRWQLVDLGCAVDAFCTPAKSRED
jgi:hypothetical protein